MRQKRWAAQGLIAEREGRQTARICDKNSWPHRRVAFWRTKRVTCIVLIADDDSGILDPGAESSSEAEQL